jgi:hypothetical protein
MAIDPDPLEVEGLRFVKVRELETALAEDPEEYSAGLDSTYPGSKSAWTWEPRFTARVDGSLRKLKIHKYFVGFRTLPRRERRSLACPNCF